MGECIRTLVPFSQKLFELSTSNLYTFFNYSFSKKDEFYRTKLKTKFTKYFLQILFYFFIFEYTIQFILVQGTLAKFEAYWFHTFTVHVSKIY